MITLIGHGYIGKYIQKELKLQNIHHEWITHRQAVPANTTAIINAAGYTGFPNVDACEKYKQETIDGNVLFPLQLEQTNLATPIVHITSGCVYTGYKDNGWTEEDTPNFDFSNGSFYSGSKALFQKLMTPYLDKSYLLRIRMPFSYMPEQKNILTKLSSYQKLIDYENSFSDVTDVARVAVHFALNKPTVGIYNVCNPGSVTTKQVANKLKLDKEWFTENEFKEATIAPRSNCVMNVEKLSAIFPIKHIDDALDAAIGKYVMSSHT